MRVLAEHECGAVPPAYADWLCDTSRTHWLGLITNICSPKDRWLDQFARDGIDGVFSASVWSSDGRSIKPSAVLFEEILAAWPGSRDRLAMVGDSPRCDIAGAQRVGLATILVGNTDHAGIQPTHRYQSILEIPTRHERGPSPSLDVRAPAD
jgi:FMN phosphatase YigB (HAD superfamily)